MPRVSWAERLEEVYQDTEDAKAAAGLVDFEDILLLNAGLIRDNLAVAEQVRQWCCWLTVDEHRTSRPAAAGARGMARRP